MPFSRKTWNRATSLLFILAYSLVAAFPSKLDHLGLVLAGRDSNTAVSTFNSQINQDGLVSGNVKAELFPTGGATSYGNPEDTFLDYGDGNPQAELISANPSEISRCGQDVNQVPSGKVRFKRQKPDICLPDAYQTKPGAVQQKTPVKNQIEGQEQPPNPGLIWEPFPPFSKPQTGPTIDGKCPNLDYTVAVCYAPWKSSVIPQGGLLGGLMGLLDPVSFASKSSFLIPCEIGGEKSFS